MEVRLLNQQPSARFEGGGHLPDHRRSVIGDLVQQGAAGYQIVGVRWQLARAHIHLLYREVLCGDQPEDRRVDVDGRHIPRRADRLTEPLRNAAVTAAELEALPAPADPKGGEV